MNEWKEYKALDFCYNVTDGTHDSPKQKEEGYYLITSKHLKDNGIDFASAKKISEEDYLKVIQRSKVEQYDILYSMIGTIGNICQVKDEKVNFAVKNMGIFKMGGDELKSKWLYYWLKSPMSIHYVSSRLAGSTQSYLTLNSLREYPVLVPNDEDTMKRIVSILSSLDDKIEVNRRINEQLEELAGALFKSWFVDFEPFKDGEFVDSELGMIPKGWKVISFKDFITPSSEKAFVGDLPEYSVTNNGILPRDEKFKKQLSKTTSKNKVLKKNNLVFGMSREILNWGIMEDPIGGVSSAYNVYIIDEKLINPKYLRLYMKAKITYFNDLIGNAAREGQSLDKTALLNKIIYLPCKDIWEAFLSKYNTIKEKISEGAKEITHLTTLRDTLLPKLMSGEIDVNEVEI